MKQEYDDSAVANDDEIAAMNREYDAARSRNGALQEDGGIAAPCREYAAMLTFCLDYCSDDAEREAVGFAAGTLISIGGTPSAPPSGAFDRSPSAQVRRCAAGMCRLARTAAEQQGDFWMRAALRLTIAATGLLFIK